MEINRVPLKARKKEKMVQNIMMMNISFITQICRIQWYQVTLKTLDSLIKQWITTIESLEKRCGLRDLFKSN